MNATILEVKKVRHGWVRIRFTRSGGGCSSWQTIVDAALSYIAAFAESLGVEAMFLDGDKSLGRGARVELPLRLYLAVRVALEQLDAAAHAMARERFMIDDKGAVTQLLIALARGYCTQDQGWRATLMSA